MWDIVQFIVGVEGRSSPRCIEFDVILIKYIELSHCRGFGKCGSGQLESIIYKIRLYVCELHPFVNLHLYVEVLYPCLVHFYAIELVL